MNTYADEMRRQLEQILEDFPNIRAADIPGIDLYMDQVTTFLQESLRGVSRNPDGDKFLTKTMINNYVKNKVLLPPVKKKYSREHMMLLIMIYYMKSFLSIGDIRLITAPVMERYGAGKGARSITDIYGTISGNVAGELPRIHEDILRQIDLAEGDFKDVPEEERALLQRFSLICRLSAEVYVRQLFIEKLLDAGM